MLGCWFLRLDGMMRPNWGGKDSTWGEELDGLSRWDLQELFGCSGEQREHRRATYEMFSS